MDNSKMDINSPLNSLSLSKNSPVNDVNLVGNNVNQASVDKNSNNLGINRDMSLKENNKVDGKSYAISGEKSNNAGNNWDISSIKKENSNDVEGATSANGDKGTDNLGINRVISSIKMEEIDEVKGQKNSSSPSAELAAHLCRRVKLHEELRNIEKQVYDMETSYLQDTSQCGNVLKGFEGFLSSSKNTTLLKRSRKFQPEDRLFSLSSVTSPAAEEQAREGGLAANGQGKPKRGRGGPREARKPRQSSDADYDYEDDPDSLM